jgi:hypothetical protein
MPVTSVRSKQQFVVNSDVSFGSAYRVTNLLDPSAAQDAATKAYVDATRTGLDIKASVRVASTANVTVTYSATGGTSTRGQITAAPNTLDGVTLAANDRILLKDQSTGAQNGIWVVTTLGTGANGVWDRAIDFDADTEVTAGAFTFVEEGTTNSDSGWVLTTNNPIIIGGASGTALVWVLFSSAGSLIAGAGLTKTGNAIDVVTASATRIVVNADSIDLATVTAGGSATSQIRKLDFDAYGRLTQATNATLSDINTTIGSQTQNTVYAAPGTGGAGNPSFRALIAADIPNLDASKITTGALAATVGGTAQSTYTTGDILYASAANTLSKLAIGGTNQILTVIGGVPSWQNATAGFTNPMTTLGDIIYGAASGTATRLAGNTTTTPQFLGSTGNGTTSAAPAWTSSTGSGNVVLATSPSIAGGTHTALTSLGIRDTSAAFDVTIAATSSTALTAGRTLTINMVNAARTLKLAGNIDIANNFTTSGNFALTLTTTGATNVTLPTTGTLATVAGTLSSSTTSTQSGYFGDIFLYDDSTPSHYLGITNSANLTAARTLSINVNDADRTISLSGNLTLANSFTTSGNFAVTLTATATTSVTLPSIGGTLISQSNYIVRDVPSGTPNGTTTTFGLLYSPIAGTEHVYVNGVLQNAGSGNDYTMSGQNVVFNTSPDARPQSGDVILVTYLRANP